MPEVRGPNLRRFLLGKAMEYRIRGVKVRGGRNGKGVVTGSRMEVMSWGGINRLRARASTEENKRVREVAIRIGCVGTGGEKMGVAGFAGIIGPIIDSQID